MKILSGSSSAKRVRLIRIARAFWRSVPGIMPLIICLRNGKRVLVININRILILF